MLIEMMNTTDASPCSAAAFFRWGRHAWVSPSAPHTLTSKILRHFAEVDRFERLERVHAERVVDEPVEAAVRVDRAVDQRPDLLGVDEVRRDGERPAAGGLDLLLDLGEVLGVAGREHHGRALPGERPGVGLAEARPDSRDDDDFVLQQHPPIRAQRDAAGATWAL